MLQSPAMKSVSSTSAAVPLSTCLLPTTLRPLYRARLHNNLNRRRLRNGTCRAEFANDAPYAVAIGACILSSWVFPTKYSEDDDGESTIDSADARFAVMGIISIIPYFNWMSWVFAWLDTGKPRYAIYALVYLAPYLSTNLSLSPEDSLVPIASILLCIFHIQKISSGSSWKHSKKMTSRYWINLQRLESICQKRRKHTILRSCLQQMR
ncbi:uncharacterized protein LOC132634721 isoform X2 [Lycium barbarum]|uniref:uncharacterized protein LOC132634721 isoform X2 n=1 Tax=Lycium barbarum TaxID=112863 RepID=UPI00293E9800|nr:uncharacterized protein LOC132634721 isoform X2 [Lycium barbarum]